MDPEKATTQRGARSEHRSERAQERRAAMTSRELGYELAFLPRPTLRHKHCRPFRGTDPLPATGEARTSLTPA